MQSLMLIQQLSPCKWRSLSLSLLISLHFKHGGLFAISQSVLSDGSPKCQLNNVANSFWVAMYICLFIHSVGFIIVIWPHLVLTLSCMATLKLLRFVFSSCFHNLDAGDSDRLVIVSSSAAAVFLCTCILLTVFLVRWNSSRGWLSDTVSFPCKMQVWE